MKIYKNDRGGLGFDGQSETDLILTKRRDSPLHVADGVELSNAEFANWHFVCVRGNEKLEALWSVIKWLFK